MEQAKQSFITDDEYLRLAQDRWIEIVDGELVEMSPNSFDHNDVGRLTFRVLDGYTIKNPTGVVYYDGVIYVFERYPNGSIKKSRIPDLSFMRKERMPEDRSRPFDGAPDLAVEVVAPGNEAEEITARVNDFLDNGSEEVWVLYPKAKEIHRFRRDDPSKALIYRGDDVLEPESLFPGLKIVTSQLFV